MSFDFPPAPTLNQLFTPPGGPTYIWNGTAWRKAGGPTELALRAARNRIVNGAMQISQEWGNTAMSQNAYYAVDQWIHFYVTSGTLTFQRVQVATPSGSANRYRITVGTADAAVAAGDYVQVLQTLEGSRVADFRWGTAAAKRAVLRFGWKSPAGTYSVAINSSTGNRCYIANFTISAAQAGTDTEQVLVIPGDVAGTWPVDFNASLIVRFCVMCGTTYQVTPLTWQTALAMGTAANTNGMATAGNVFEFFDVGLYLDDQNTGVAPRWEMPDEAQELTACMRYFERGDGGIANTHWDAIEFKVNKRVAAAMVASPALSNIGAAITAFTFNNASVLNFQWTASARL